MAVFWRTDEGVCPYIVGMLLFKEGVSSYRREAFFTSKKRPLRLKEGVPLFLVRLFQLARYHLATLKLYYTGIPTKPYFKPK